MFALPHIHYVVLEKLGNLSEVNFSHLQNRGDNTRISDAVPGSCSNGPRKLVGKVRHKHMALIRDKVRNIILIEASYAMEAMKEKYKFLVIQAGEDFPFMKCGWNLGGGGRAEEVGGGQAMARLLTLFSV